MNKGTKETVLPLITAAIWGTAFVFQSIAAGSIGTFTFNFSRCVLAVISLFPLALYSYLKHGLGKKTILGGTIAGIFLAIACCLQQSGLEETSAGKAAFITAMYIMLVPLAGFFTGNKPTKRIMLGVLIAVIGLYFLCVNEDFSISRSDILVVLCAIMFTGQILVIDKYVSESNDIVLSWIMFISMAVFCGIMMLIFEEPNIESIKNCAGSIIYLGVFSSGVAYTLQIVAQNGTNPTIVSLLMSMESVFALIASALILHERLSLKEMIGCLLMIAAIIICKIPEKNKS